MSGNQTGGKLAAKKNLERDPNFYANIGRLGGRKGRTGGFASKLVDENGMTGQDRAREYGRVGGRISRRTKAAKPVVVIETVGAEDDEELAAA